MTSTQPSGLPVDFDLLADYAEGLLPGDEAARVEALVEHETAWSSAFAALNAALPSVATALAGAATERPTMPTDIADRLGATIRGLVADRPADDVRTLPVPGREPSSRPADTRPATRSTARKRRRTGRDAVLAAVVLIVVVIGGLAIINHRSRPPSSSSAATSAAGVADSGVPATAEGDLGPVLTSTGTDYTRASLHPSTVTPQLAPTGKQPYATTPTVPGPDAAQKPQIPAGLARLGGASALAACVNAVQADTGGTATVVDYASFNGTPALIITLSGINLVVAVGADCGLPGSGSDELARQ